MAGEYALATTELLAKVRTDIRSAGGKVVGQEVVTDVNLTSSRWPDDLPAFCARVVGELAAAAPERLGAS